ncbi:MAG: hypothetical protein WCI81_01110 [Chlorobiaceae bacterium]
MVWQFNDVSWKQDDAKQLFELQSLFGQQCTIAPVAPSDLLVGAHCHPKGIAPCAQGFFPAEFLYCPFCQAKLLLNEDILDLWIPPYGSGTGLKLYKRDTVNKKKTGDRDYKAKQFILPNRDGRFAFCSVKFGAKKRLLIAVQRDCGQLWVYRPDNVKNWEVLSVKAGGDSLPAWSWSMAVDSSESGFCIPTDHGPAWLTVDWSSGSIQVDYALGTSIGGAVRVGQYLVAPVRRGDVFFLVFRKDGDSKWSDCFSNGNAAGVLGQLQRSSDQVACLGIPVVDENKMIAYWPCRGGYVRVTGADLSSGPIWDFKCWETDDHPATALIELGPPYRRFGADSGFWQLCVDRDQAVRDGIINKIIKIDGDERIDSENVLDGQFLTTGRSCFSWSNDYWDDVHTRNPRDYEQTELRFPLIQFGEKGLSLIAKVAPWEGRDEMGEFTDIFFNRNLKITVMVRLVLEGSGLPEHVLYAEECDGTVNGLNGTLFRITLAQLPDITPFIYNDLLFVYFPERNDCFCWPLELAEG